VAVWQGTVLRIESLDRLASTPGEAESDPLVRLAVGPHFRMSSLYLHDGAPTVPVVGRI
jgi:hypothetical protein